MKRQHMFSECSSSENNPIQELYRGSTPAHIFETNVDLSKAKVYVTYRQNGVNIIEKTNNELDINENVVVSRLTQEESLSLQLGRLQVQIRYVTEDGIADASEILEFEVEKILKEGFIAYSDASHGTSLFNLAKRNGYEGSREDWDGLLKGQSPAEREVDYTKLKNKPSINGISLEGNPTFEELGEETITNQEIQSIIDKYFSEVFIDG